MIGRFIRLVIVAFVGAIAASTVGALIAKSRVVSRGEPEDDEIALATIMDQLEFESTAKAFRGGSVLLWMGGGDIDLRGATLDPDGATLNITAITGGGRIIVPPTWRISTSVLGIMGGIGDTRGVDDEDLPADAPHLDLTGVLFMGGFALTTTDEVEEDDDEDEDDVAEVIVKAVGKKNGKSADTVESGTASA